MAGKSFLDKMLHFIGWEDVDEGDDDTPSYTPQRRPAVAAARPQSVRSRTPQENVRPSSHSNTRRPENVVNFKQDASRQRTVIYRIRSIEETRNVITDLIENKTILLNLEDLDEAYVQRANDILSGAAFALKATFLKTSHRAYLIAPPFVKVDNINDYNG